MTYSRTKPPREPPFLVTLSTETRGATFLVVLSAETAGTTFQISLFHQAFVLM
jgi:hypothetical protein